MCHSRFGPGAKITGQIADPVQFLTTGSAFWTRTHPSSMPKRSHDCVMFPEGDRLPERSFVRRKTLQMDGPIGLKLGDYSSVGWQKLHYGRLRPEVQATLDEDELWSLSKPALAAEAWTQCPYPYKRHVAEWRVDWPFTRALQQTPCAIMGEGGDLGLLPSQAVVQVRTFFAFHRPDRSSHWAMRLVLDLEGNHWVLPGVRADTHVSEGVAAATGMDAYQNLPIDLSSSFQSRGDPEKDDYIPPYPLEDDMHATLKKRWQDTARSMHQALEDPFLQAQIVHEVRRKLPNEFAALPDTATKAQLMRLESWVHNQN